MVRKRALPQIVVKRLISVLLCCIIVICTFSGCSKTDDERAYSIDSYKAENSGLSGQIDTDAVTESDGAEKSQDTVTEQNDKPLQLPEDYDTEDIEVSEAAESEIDTSTKENSQHLPYVENVETSAEYTEITEDSYDESKLTLPCIRIETFDGKAVTSKTAYKNSTIEIDNTDAAFTKEKTAVEIRGRGNSTWSRFEKKAYKLRFSMKTDLFGMGSAKKWVLLANALDETMLRNSIAFDLARVLEVEYVTGYVFVDLFINGEYLGVYQLCEQLEEGDSRVDVESSKTGIVDTGYLIESYGENTQLEEKTFTIPAIDGVHIRKNGKHQFVIKSPGTKTATDAQVNFIRNYIIKANKAILKGDFDTFSQTCDVDSFVNMFLVDELMLNNDMGYSFYMYKKTGGKLYLGPAWDYDQSAGSSQIGGSTYKGWYAGTQHGWYNALIEMPEFRALVKQRYNEKKAEIEQIFNSIDTTVQNNRYDFAMSNYVYNTFGSHERWRTFEDIYTLTTYTEHIDYLKTWLTNRKIWMEDQFKAW